MFKSENSTYITRFIEVCGTSEPANIQRLLNISYQAAKNYLNGRMPDTNMLRVIADKTPYSIHWLITGKGEKFVFGEPLLNTPFLTDQMRTLIRQECVEVINDFMKLETLTQPKVVVLQSDKLRSEKVKETAVFSDGQS